MSRPAPVCVALWDREARTRDPVYSLLYQGPPSRPLVHTQTRSRVTPYRERDRRDVIVTLRSDKSRLTPCHHYQHAASRGAGSRMAASSCPHSTPATPQHFGSICTIANLCNSRNPFFVSPASTVRPYPIFDALPGSSSQKIFRSRSHTTSY